MVIPESAEELEIVEQPHAAMVTVAQSGKNSPADMYSDPDRVTAVTSPDVAYAASNPGQCFRATNVFL